MDLYTARIHHKHHMAKCQVDKDDDKVPYLIPHSFENFPSDVPAEKCPDFSPYNQGSHFPPYRLPPTLAQPSASIYQPAAPVHQPFLLIPQQLAPYCRRPLLPIPCTPMARTIVPTPQEFASIPQVHSNSTCIPQQQIQSTGAPVCQPFLPYRSLFPMPYIPMAHTIAPTPASIPQATAVHSNSIYTPQQQIQLNQPVKNKPCQHRMEIAESYAANEETFEGRVREDLSLSEIKVELDRRNYKRKFCNLICWEEKECIEILGNKCDSKCDLILFELGVIPSWIRSMFCSPMRYGFLQNVSTDQVARATLTSEAAFIVSKDGNHEVKLEILRENYDHCDEKIYVAFLEDQSNELCRISISPQPLPKGEVTIPQLNIAFEVKHSYFNTLIRAVNGIDSMIIKRILPTPEAFPQADNEKDFASVLHVPLISHEITVDSEDQSRALCKILSCDKNSPPLLVNGSFGTGKTRLLAVATHCLIKDGQNSQTPVRVLICAHHQISADYFIEQYFGPMFKGKKNIKLIRLTSGIYNAKWSQYPQFYMKITDLCYFRLTDYLVIVTTFLTAPSLLRLKLKPGFFTHILMDEGSQSTEPEAIAPLCLATPSTMLVIAGDSCQVGPSMRVLGEEARENGLKYSLLERLQALYQKYGGCALRHMVSLNTNYRCHEDVMKIPNELFYESKIKSHPQDAFPHHMAAYPLVFVCSSLTSEVNHELEAQLLLKEVERFVISNWPVNWCKKDPRKVCIVTPSRTQLVVTRHLACTKFKELKELSCICMLTTYHVQGQEFQAVFMSTTEPVDSKGNTTNPTKSPCDPYVFNTVLTRSKSLVVVIGSPMALLKIEEHMEKLYGRKAYCWSNYLRLCLEKDSFVIPPAVESSSVKRHDFKLFIDKKVSRIRTQLADSVPQHLHAVSPDCKHLNSSPAKQTSSSIFKQPSSPPTKPSSVGASKQQNLPPAKLSGIFRQPSSPPTKHSTPKQQNPPSIITKQHSTKCASVGCSNQQHSPLLKFFLPKFDPLSVKMSSHEVGSPKVTVQTINPTATPSSSAKHSSESYTNFKDQLESNRSVLKEQLGASNYTKKFHYLLYWEEQEHARQLGERCSKVQTYSITILQSGIVPLIHQYEIDKMYERFGYLESEDSDALAHAKQASEGSFIMLGNNIFAYAEHVHGTVPYEASRNAIIIAFSKKEHETLKTLKPHCGMSYNFRAKVQFELKHSYFHQLHGSLARLSWEVIQRLNPTRHSFSSYSRSSGESFQVDSKPAYSNLTLDEDEQMNALYAILRSTPALPVVVTGPFGTGKTRLLARAAYEILKKNETRVLICTYQQVSADTFVEYFGAMKSKKHNPWNIGMVRVIPNHPYYSKTRDEHRRFYKTKEDLLLCDLEKNRLVVTTFGTASALYHKLPGGRKREFFTDILIDEGAQTREPETIGPLSLAGKSTKIVIAGDHYQCFSSAKGWCQICAAKEGTKMKCTLLSPGVVEHEDRLTLYFKIHTEQVGPKSVVLGEEARSNGLSVSLLERLHSLYDRANMPLNSCSVTLLTNYRCHSGILMLPSSLYYQSTLQCSVSDDIAHYLAPFPLTFVCSDIRQSIEKTSGVNEIEADVLMKEVQKYFMEWPKQWDKRICIMSPSANQCSLLKKKVKDIHCHGIIIEVLKAYDIQGKEFQAIFISTSEETNENGDPVDETRSLCDRYVFNTALTRSRSLVVAVGNPFLLLNMEESMVKKHDATYRTWTPYIKQCIECNTFSYAESVKKLNFVEATYRLYDSINSDSVSENQVLTSKSLDSIIKNYNKLFESMPECKDTKKLILSISKDERLSWTVNSRKNHSMSKQKEVDYSEHYQCILKIDTYHRAEAIPLDSSKKTVKIHGRYNHKGAFDGETVEVGIFKDNPPGKNYGRVCNVIERDRNDLKFICRVSENNPIVFYPTDMKSPKFINLPKLSRVFKKKEQGKKIVPSDLDVVVFDSSSFNVENRGNCLPRIKQVIPISVARDMLFLVSFVKWEKKFPNPLGIVIGAYRKGHTLYNAERVLKAEFSVEYSSTEDDNSISTDAEQSPDLRLYDRAFTIDPEGAKNLDDALSIGQHGTDENSHKVYQLGVHIANVAKYIQPDSMDDKFAKEIGTSVYGGEKGNMMHMLHDKGLRSKLSLIPGKLRDVISVTCSVTIIDHSNPDSFIFHDCSISPAQIRSAIQLTYKHAQDILDGNIPTECTVEVERFDENRGNLSLQKSIGLLYAIVQALRQRRLQSDAAFAYEVNEPDEVSCWQAHLLVEELMIWANNEVAMHLHQNYPDAALLNRQPAPNEEKKQAIVDCFGSVMACSLQYVVDEDGLSADVLIPLDTLKQIHRALNENDKTFLTHLLSSDRLYPQLAAVRSKFRSISQRAQYCCTEVGEIDSSAYRHHSLCLDNYTHFSSPIRRYIDIEVQRMLLAQVQAERREFSHSKGVKLCQALNKKKNKAKDFEKNVKIARFTQKLVANISVCTAFICNKKKSSVELTFPDLELSHFPYKAKSLRVASFIPSAEESDVYIWNLHITTLKSNFAAGLLEKLGLPVSSSRDVGSTIVKAFCISDDSSLETEQFVPSQQSSVIKVSPTLWLEVLQFVKELTEEKMHKMKAILPQVPFVPSSKSFKTNKNYLFLDCDVKTSLKQFDVLKVWLTWSMRKPVMSPAIQLVEVSPLLRICVQHNSHPAECFSDHSLLPASKKDYATITDYVERWKKVLLAEAAEKSVKERQPVIIRDVHLQWPDLRIPEECIEDEYYFPGGSVKMILPKHFVENCYEFFRVGVGDLVCVRYGCDPHQLAKAVYHFVVHDSEQPENDGLKKEGSKEIVVSMEPVGKANCRVSVIMKKYLETEAHTCEVQIIPLSYSYRKVFRGLLALKSGRKVSHLSRNVALDPERIKEKKERGKAFLTVAGINSCSGHSRARHIANTDELAQSISKWAPGTESIDLNEGQKEAMYKALDEPFQLIQGPPGTGKSVTGAHIAYVFAKFNKALNTPKSHKCVLYCGPSNKSVDVVFEKFVKLLETRKELGLHILRLYSSAVEMKDYPGPKHQTHRKPVTLCPDWAKPYALHHMIRQSSRTEPEFVKLAELEREIKDMRDNNKIATGKLCNEYRRVLGQVEEKFLSMEKFDIIFCTCNEASGGRMKRYKHLSPRQCIIDECGMAYEPETIVPIGLCEHAVLIGDHKQLQPVIYYQPARDNGLTTSLFERYARDYKDEYIFTLETQYRMHEAICAFPSEEFYDNKLKTDASVQHRNNNEKLDSFWPKGNRLPLMFVDIVGEEGEDEVGSSKTETKVGVGSKYNVKEAQLVVEIVKKLHHEHEVDVDQIAVLTPYSAQKNKILEVVKKLPRKLRTLKVASITESQGDEYGIVILSTVRSQPPDQIFHKEYVQPDYLWRSENLGFITDDHQINVGITRSKMGLVITGNRILLEYDSTWEKLLKHYDEKKCVVDASRFQVKS